MKYRTNSFKVSPAILLGISVLVSSYAFAAETTATVVASRGNVSAVSTDIERILGQGDVVYVNDRVVTSDRSFAVLQFVDGAKVTVRPNSAMVIEEYVYNGGDQDAATLSLVEGGLRVITGAMAKSHPENYKVRTPVALMGVRGTEFAVMLCGDDICSEEDAARGYAEN
jgi:hypothetical protein